MPKTIVKKNQTALATGTIDPIRMAGEEPGDQQPNEAKLIQPNSESTFAPGSLVLFPDGEAVHEAVTPFEPWELTGVVFLHLRSYYRAWSDESVLLYSGKSLDWVESNHPDHLEYGSGRNGEGERAQRVIAAIMLSDNREEPWCIAFTGTQKYAAIKINNIERGRAAHQQGAGYYTLRVIKRKSKYGSSFFAWEVDPPGEIPEDKVKRVQHFAQAVREAAALAGLRNEAEPVESPVKPPADDQIPF